jgi:hypothetical protein
VLEYLPSKCKALSSNSSTSKKKWAKDLNGDEGISQW